MGIFSFVKAGKKTFEIVKPKIAKNLKQKFDAKQKMFKAIDKAGPNLSTVQKGKIKKDGSKDVDRIFKKYENRAKGGRVGLKLGSRKSNVQKIQETFGPKKKVPNKFKGFSKLPEKVQQKIDAKLAKKV
jgi:hypothetical protein